MDSHAQGIEISRQADQHSEAIGNGTPSGIIEGLAEFAQDAALDDFYRDHSDVAFWYQALDKDGWKPKVRDVADAWLGVSGLSAIFKSSDLTIDLIVAGQR